MSQPFNVFGVAALDAVATTDGVRHVLVDSDDNTNRMMVYKFETGDIWQLYAVTALPDGASDSSWNVWSVLFNGVASQFWIDGVSAATGSVGAHNADGLTIGADRAGGAGWDGDITSVVICDPSLSDAQRVAMQTATNAYWGCF